MDCERVREHLIDYLYGELSPEMHASVEAALDECADCAAELAEMKQVHEMAASLPSLDVPGPVHHNILREARLHADAVHGKRRGRFSLATWFTSPALASALVIVMALGVGITLTRQGSVPNDAAYETASDAPSATADNRDGADQIARNERAQDESRRPRGNAESNEGPAPSADNDPSSGDPSVGDPETDEPGPLARLGDEDERLQGTTSGELFGQPEIGTNASRARVPRSPTPSETSPVTQSTSHALDGLARSSSGSTGDGGLDSAEEAASVTGGREAERTEALARAENRERRERSRASAEEEAGVGSLALGSTGRGGGGATTESNGDANSGLRSEALRDTAGRATATDSDDDAPSEPIADAVASARPSPDPTASGEASPSPSALPARAALEGEPTPTEEVEPAEELLAEADLPGTRAEALEMWNYGEAGDPVTRAAGGDSDWEYYADEQPETEEDSYDEGAAVGSYDDEHERADSERAYVVDMDTHRQIAAVEAERETDSLAQERQAAAQRTEDALARGREARRTEPEPEPTPEPEPVVAAEPADSYSARGVQPPADERGEGPQYGSENSADDGARDWDNSYERAVSRYNDGSYREAVVLFDEFMQNAPATSSFRGLASHYRGIAAYRTGDYNEAVRSLNEVLEIPGFERTDETRYYLAQAYEALGRLDDAEIQYRALSRSGRYSAESEGGIERLRATRRSRSDGLPAVEQLDSIQENAAPAGAREAVE